MKWHPSCDYVFTGYGGADCFRSLNFYCRFNGYLSLELSNNHPNMRIIHRKVALILGQWVSEVSSFLLARGVGGLIFFY